MPDIRLENRTGLQPVSQPQFKLPRFQTTKHLQLAQYHDHQIKNYNAKDPKRKRKISDKGAYVKLREEKSAGTTEANVFPTSMPMKLNLPSRFTLCIRSFLGGKEHYKVETDLIIQGSRHPKFRAHQFTICSRTLGSKLLDTG